MVIWHYTVYVHFLNFLHSMYKIWIVLLAASLLNCHYLRLRGFGVAIETHVLYVLKWEVLFFLGALSYMLDFDVKGIIRPLGKFWELFTGNRKNWQMAWSIVFCLKIAWLASARPSKYIPLPSDIYTEGHRILGYAIMCPQHRPYCDHFLKLAFHFFSKAFGITSRWILMILFSCFTNLKYR